jgi:hypothetical protein
MGGGRMTGWFIVGWAIAVAIYVVAVAIVERVDR